MRKIDAMVAERVMGIKVLGTAHCWISGDDGRMSVANSLEACYGTAEHPVYAEPSYDGEACADEVVIGGVPACWLAVVPFYSTDIGAAWEVVEKIRERKDKNGGSVTCHVIDRVTEWHCDITSDDLRIDVLGTGDTAPLAICLAALRAVGVDEAEIQEAM